MTDDFKDPAKPVSTVFLKPSELIGTIAVVIPRRVVYGEQKSYGKVQDTVYADVYLVKGEGAGSEYINTDITNSKLVGQFSDEESMGQLLLGRFAYGEGKAGKRPVVFASVYGEDRADAARWVSNNRGRIDRSLAAARASASQPVPATAGGSWGSPPPPPPVTNHDAPQY